MQIAPPTRAPLAAHLACAEGTFETRMAIRTFVRQARQDDQFSSSGFVEFGECCVLSRFPGSNGIQTQPRNDYRYWSK
jgi:hypothetical protein